MHHRPGFYGHTLHLQGPNLVVVIDGDDAVATGYNVLLHETASIPSILRIGGNRWRFRRAGKRWLMAERRHRSVGERDFAVTSPTTRCETGWFRLGEWLSRGLAVVVIRWCVPCLVPPTGQGATLTWTCRRPPAAPRP